VPYCLGSQKTASTSLTNQSLCLNTWISRNLLLLPSQSEPVFYYLNSQKPTSTAWPIRACVLLPGFSEDWFNSLANQSLCLTTLILRRLVLQLSDQAEPVSIYLDFRKPVSLTWPIRAFVYYVDSLKNSLTNQRQCFNT
jgi:hypothetical protein